jgi:hypothetical protein
MSCIVGILGLLLLSASDVCVVPVRFVTGFILLAPGILARLASTLTASRQLRMLHAIE